MKDKQLVELHSSFEEKIKSFRQSPKDYEYKVKNFQARAFQNAIASFIFWLVCALILNAIAFNYFLQSTDKADFASLMAIVFLFAAIGVRSTTVNFFLYKVIGNMGKLHRIHQFINRIGFFHRYMATSTLVWLLIYLLNKEFKAPYLDELIILALGGFLTLIIVTASSFFRRKNHNIFENVHRYVGYISFILLTTYLFISSINEGISVSEVFYTPHMLFLLFIIMMLIAPWIGVKKVNPELVHVGPHVIGMKIKGKPSFGTYSSITLADYNFHPFGDSMYDFDDMENRTLYMTPAGDRTTEIVNAANKGEFLLKECTLKNDRKCGFMYHHSVYDKVLIVVTGGGIAPIIPCLVLNNHTKFIVLWISHSPVREFTEEVLTTFTQKIAPKNIYLHILNTDDEDLKSFTNATYTTLALDACKHYNPEAVFVMSNQKFTIDMMHSLEENNYKSYGANFDS